MNCFSKIEYAIKEIKKGKMVIVVDNEDRENEGDLIMAADKITADSVNFMTKYGRGLICTSITKKKAEELRLPLMVPQNTSLHETAFTVSVDVNGSGTGISSFNRAKTIKALSDKTKKADDFMRPGHIFPLISEENGVLKRNGHTEAAIDISRLAGFSECGVLCEILAENGEMSKLDELILLSKKFNLCIIRISDLIEYRKKNENLVEFNNKVKMPTKYGEFDLLIFRSKLNKDICHFALIKDIDNVNIPIVRIHSECLTGDVLSSLRCDCGDQFNKAMETISLNGGILIYLRQEGRGIGFFNKMRTYSLQEKGFDTVEANLELGFEADERDYFEAAQILRAIGKNEIELLTNNPDKIENISKYGIKVRERLSIEIETNNFNEFYMLTKKDKMKHIFS